MIAFKKEDPVLKRSNKILTGVENRLRVPFVPLILLVAGTSEMLGTYISYKEVKVSLLAETEFAQ